MIEETARVIEASEDKLVLETIRKTACGSCGSQGECGVSAVSGLFRDKAIRLEMPNSIGAEPGDDVIVGIEERAFLRMTFLTYLLPLVTAMAGAIVFSLAGFAQGWVIAAAIAGFAAGLYGARFFGKELFSGALQVRKEKSAFQARPLWVSRL